MIEPTLHTYTSTSQRPSAGDIALRLGDGLWDLFSGSLGRASGGLIGGATGGVDTDLVKSQLADQQEFQMRLIEIQMAIQNQGQSTTATSNVAKAVHETKMAAVRNLRS